MRTELKGGSGFDGVDLDPAALTAVLRAELGGSLTLDLVEPIPTGASNRMYALHSSAGRFVLRLPPTHKTSASAHDVAREYRMLRALDATDVPHPHAVLHHGDPTALGAPFLVMEFVDGFNLTAGAGAPDRDPAAVRALAYAAVDALAALGEVDWRAAGLDGFGRPTGFLDRQVDRWGGQLASYQTRELPGIQALAGWLRDNRPAPGSPGIMHGDFTFMNVLFRRTRPAAVASIVDWEQSTIADPLLDLGWFLGLWAEASEQPATTRPGQPWVTQLPGMPSRADVVQRYRQRSGRDTAAIGYYQALALFKLAVVLEGGYATWRRGASHNPHHRDFEWMVPALIRTALAATRGER